MFETHGPALDAAVAYQRERIFADYPGRAARARRAARAAQAQALAAGQTHGLTAVLRGRHLPGSEAWHAPR